MVEPSQRTSLREAVYMTMIQLCQVLVNQCLMMQLLQIPLELVPQIVPILEKELLFGQMELL
jgi:hypothetical protein